MLLTAPARTVALTALLMTGMTLAATAQSKQAESQPGNKMQMLLAQEEPEAPGGGRGGGGDEEEEDQGAQPNQPRMMHPGMMGGRMHGMPMMGMHGTRMLKIMFAIADTDEDGSLSFEEVTAIHKRIFDMIDTNKDGKVTLEELEAFMRD